MPFIQQTIICLSISQVSIICNILSTSRYQGRSECTDKKAPRIFGVGGKSVKPCFWFFLREFTGKTNAKQISSAAQK